MPDDFFPKNIFQLSFMYLPTPCRKYLKICLADQIFTFKMLLGSKKYFIDFVVIKKKESVYFCKGKCFYHSRELFKNMA